MAKTENKRNPIDTQMVVIHSFVFEVVFVPRSQKKYYGEEYRAEDGISEKQAIPLKHIF